MNFSTVMNFRKKGDYQGYSLDPKEALVAAYEQSLGNMQTWTYKSPDQYPIREDERAYYLGHLFVLKKDRNKLDDLTTYLK